LHNREARPVDEREVLVAEGLADGPSSLTSDASASPKAHGTAAQPIPEELGDLAPVTAIQQEPCLNQHMIGRHRVERAGEDGLRLIVVYIACGGGGEPNRRVAKTLTALLG